MLRRHLGRSSVPEIALPIQRRLTTSSHAPWAGHSLSPGSAQAAESRRARGVLQACSTARPNAVNSSFAGGA